MEPAKGTKFERFGGANEVDTVEALLVGYATGNDIVKEAAFQAFLGSEQPVAVKGREAISRLAQVDPWIAAEFTFNLMAAAQNFQYGDPDSLKGLSPDDCWEMAATSLPYISSKATHDLVRGFCVLMDEKHGFIGRLKQCNNVAASALRNGCSPETVQLVVRSGVAAIKKEDERIPGRCIVDSIKGTRDYSTLEDVKFLNLLDITKMASAAGSEEDTGYLVSILDRVLGRLDSVEAKLYVPEIIDTYLALGETSQQTINLVLAQILKSASATGLTDMDETTLREIAKRYRDERYEYSSPNPEHYKAYLPADTQLFWPGDVVEMLDTTGYKDCWGQPARVESRQIIKDVNRNVYPQAEDEAERHYETDSVSGIKATNFRLVERGELWKYCHGEITEFTDPSAAYEYALRTVDYRFVKQLNLSERDKDSFFPTRYIQWHKDEVLEAVELGYADGLVTELNIFIDRRDIVAIKFNDPKISQLIANSTLVGFGRRVQKVAA